MSPVPLQPAAPERRAFHAAPLAAVLAYWWSDAERGLASAEASKRLARLGENRLPAPLGGPVGTVAVIRDGTKAARLPTTALVPGDLVELGAGERVPADLRLVTSHELLADERALLGEAAARKDAAQVHDPGAPLPARANMLFLGTTIVAGRAVAAVCNTGMHTELGARLASIAPRPVPAWRRALAPAALAVLGLAALAVGLARGAGGAALAALVGGALLPAVGLVIARRALAARSAHQPLLARPHIDGLPRTQAALARVQVIAQLNVIAAGLALLGLSGWGLALVLAGGR